MLRSVRPTKSEDTAPPTELRTVALVGSHEPRRSRVAVFTTDLTRALRDVSPRTRFPVIAMTGAGKRHSYPSQVRFEVAENSLAAYRGAADFLNVNDVGVVSLQHSYDTYGGKDGAHVLALLRELRMPVVTTLHSVLAEPSSTKRAVLTEVCELSQRLVVMSTEAGQLLRAVYGVPRSKIDKIPHGVDALPNLIESKKKLGVDGHHMLLSFGLLRPDKGIEQVIAALPEITAQIPNVIYTVVGVTHPLVKERKGEAYRLMLEARAHELGVGDHVVFHDRFVSETELTQFLSAADVCITPYLNEDQTSSSTLARALGAGKAVISSSFRHARELLVDERGLLVPTCDPSSIAAEVISLLQNSDRKTQLEQRARALGAEMRWPVVATAYIQTFQRALNEHREQAPRFRPVTRIGSRTSALPEVSLTHVLALTDDTGILRHAQWSVPRLADGYSVDDNARAQLLLAQLEDARIEPPALVRLLSTRYLAFLSYAFNPKRGRFRNLLSYSRRWLQQVGSEDSHGRALWSLGTVAALSADRDQRAFASELFDAALPAALAFTGPRACAYTLLGIDEWLRAQPDDELALSVGDTLARRLLTLFENVSQPSWLWFEDQLTHGNARLSQALIVSGTRMQNEPMLNAGLSSLNWLASVQGSDTRVFTPVGSKGQHTRDGVRSTFDQYPAEACDMVSACLSAHRVSGEHPWALRARQAFDWFLGQNQLGQWLYDAGTGGCHDCLQEQGVSNNQGAEATLSFLMALVELRQLDRPIKVQAARADFGDVLPLRNGR